MLKKLFYDKEFYNKLRLVALPIAVQSLMLSLVAATDAFMLGRLDQNSMSAVSLASQVQFIQNMFLSSTTATASALGAQYWGKKDRERLNYVFAVALRLSIVISVLFFLGCTFIPRYLMLLLTNEEVLIQIGIGYLKIAGFSYLITGISQCFLTLLKCTEHTRSSAVVSSVAVVINIVLNGILIFGLFGAPALGVMGAALATLIARMIEMLLSIGLTYLEKYEKFRWSALLRIELLLDKDFFKIFLPMIGAGLLWSVGFTSYTAFMGHLGTDAAAANSIASVVRDIICCACNGIAVGGGILIGIELGQGKLQQAKEIGDKLVIISFLLGFLCTGIMAALTPLLIRVVKLTPEAGKLLTVMMLIMAFYMIGRCVNTIVINGIFDSGGDTLFDFYSLIVAMWLVAVPLAALGTFVFHWPIPVVYACTCLDEVGKIPWVLHHYRKYIWVKNLTRE